MYKLIFITFLAFCLSRYGQAAEAPSIVKGTLDLSAWDGHTPLHLNGEWHVFDGELLGPADVMQRTLAKADLLHVPHEGKAYASGRAPLALRTYILKVTGIDPHWQLALFTGHFYNCARIYFAAPDEQVHNPVYEHGKISAFDAERIAAYHANVSNPLPQGRGERLLIVQVGMKTYGNEPLYDVSLSRSILIGDAHVLKRKELRFYCESLFTVGLFLLIAIYSIALFIHRPTELGSLSFAIAAVILALRQLALDGALSFLPEDPSQVPYALILFMRHCSSNVACIFFGVFMISTFPKRFNPLILILYGIATLLNITAFFHSFPTGLNRIWWYFSISQVWIFPYFIYVYIKCYRYRDQGSVLGLVGIFFVFCGNINDLLVSLGALNSVYIAHFTVAVLFFCLSQVSGRRFALSFKEIKNLSQELQGKNTELLSQRTQIIALNTELKEYNERLEIKVEEKTRDIMSILTSIRHGILLISTPDGRVSPEHSLYLETLLGTQDIAGKNVADLCFVGSSLDHDQIDQVKNAVAMTIGEDALAFELNEAAFPKELIKISQGQERLFELDWNPIYANGRTEKLLLVLRDVSEMRKLQNEAAEQAAELQLIAEIINISPKRFRDIMGSANRLLDANFEILEQTERLNSAALNRLLTHLHTIKGMTRSYRLKRLTELVHQAEERCRLSAETLASKELLIADLNGIRELMQSMHDLYHKRLGHGAESPWSQQTDEPAKVENLLSLLHKIDRRRLPLRDQQIMAELFDRLQQWNSLPLRLVLQTQFENLERLALSLGKAVPKIVFAEDQAAIGQQYHEMLNMAFAHIIANSLDHGIEAPAARIQAGKAPEGELTFSLKLENDQLKIVFHDDGAGLNLRRIRRKALDKGWIQDDQLMKASQLAAFILEPAFSTAERVTEFSGRGVGMSAVKTFVEQHHGRFAMVLPQPDATDLDFTPFSINIFLPKTRFLKAG